MRTVGSSLSRTRGAFCVSCCISSWLVVPIFPIARDAETGGLGNEIKQLSGTRRRVGNKIKRYRACFRDEAARDEIFLFAGNPVRAAILALEGGGLLSDVVKRV